MSAFMCNDDHFNALVTWAIDNRVSYWDDVKATRIMVTGATASLVGQVLVLENIRSLVARYGDGENEQRVYSYSRFPVRLNPVQVLKAIQCLDYQCCETDDWKDSMGFRILEAIKDAAIRALPGYEGAHRELHRDLFKDRDPAPLRVVR